MHDVIIIGASGHGTVIADIIIKSGDTLLGFLDDSDILPKDIIGYPLLGKVKDIGWYINEEKIKFIVGIGSNHIRNKIVEANRNANWYTAIHPSAQIAINVTIGFGTVIMANAVINTSATIGNHCIINTGSIVEHDNVLNEYIHISPNAVLGGSVSVGKLTHIGIGAVVKNNITIVDEVVIGAGAVVVKDINEKGKYIGIPARRVNE